MFKKIKLALDMIKFEHSIFALPFAFIGAFLAQGGMPPWDKILWILVAMVSARSAAMAFNRLVDKEIDARNPRTKNRHLPRGILTPQWVHGFILFWVIVFFVTTYNLNRLVFYLSPLAIFIVMGYSYTKRFTWLSHLFLGIADGLAPLGGWLAVKPAFAAPPLWLLAGVALWVAGFDILYSCLDYEFDRKEGLHSIPVRFGIKKALHISTFFHILTLVCFFYAGKTAQLTPLYFYGLGIIGILLIGEHFLIKPNDFSLINMAFFTINGFVAIIMFFLTVFALPCI
ncbi:MAG: putative 4-hydroxybenzoate polyprenyltransferase [Candidatus Desulfofervidaceae bacterium]|nr:putative 4-hydroxybenzoate polyprenyltransferase [Candidatus Desulfofervidaceae bacterium]